MVGPFPAKCAASRNATMYSLRSVAADIAWTASILKSVAA